MRSACCIILLTCTVLSVREIKLAWGQYRLLRVLMRSLWCHDIESLRVTTDLKYLAKGSSVDITMAIDKAYCYLVWAGSSSSSSGSSSASPSSPLNQTNNKLSFLKWCRQFRSFRKWQKMSQIVKRINTSFCKYEKWVTILLLSNWIEFKWKH